MARIIHTVGLGASFAGLYAGLSGLDEHPLVAVLLLLGALALGLYSAQGFANGITPVYGAYKRNKCRQSNN